MSKALTPVGLYQAAYAVGATTAPSFAGNGALVWSTAAASTMFWNGTSWQPVGSFIPSVQFIKQNAGGSFAAAGSLTGSVMASRIVRYTGAAANLTLDTGTNIETFFSTTTPFVTDMAMDFTVINTGSGVCTLVVNTGVTAIGTLTVATATSGTFRLRKTAANTFILYRL